MGRWAIVLGTECLFTTDDRTTVRRFLAMDFMIFDHKNACYTCIAHRGIDARDLLTEADYGER